jgi:hypothetical protein
METVARRKADMQLRGSGVSSEKATVTIDGRLHTVSRPCESPQLLATYSTSLADQSPATLSTVIKGP